MANRSGKSLEITPELLLKAYACGIFPMADSAGDPSLFWVEPEWRGIIPLERFHLSHSLAKAVRQDRFEVLVDSDFEAVIDGCAAAAPGRQKTWINGRIRQLYGELFRRGHCHTVECRKGGELVGGLYGVSLGAAFFGESMFSRATDASKVALVHLVARLRAGGFRLLDTQFQTEHLARFGTIEVDRETYSLRLDIALREEGDFYALPARTSGTEALKWLAAQE